MYYREQNSTLIKCQRGLLEKQLVQLHCDCRKGVGRAGLSDAHYTWTHAYCFGKVVRVASWCVVAKGEVEWEAGQGGGADTRLVKVRDGSDAANDRSKFQPSCVRVSFPSGHIGPIIEELMDRWGEAFQDRSTFGGPRDNPAFAVCLHFWVTLINPTDGVECAELSCTVKGTLGVHLRKWKA